MTKHNLMGKKFSIQQENVEDIHFDGTPKTIVFVIVPDEFFSKRIIILKAEIAFDEAETQGNSTSLSGVPHYDPSSNFILRLYQKQSLVEELLDIFHDFFPEKVEEPELAELFDNAKQVLMTLNHIFKGLENLNVTVEEDDGVKWN